MREFLVERCGNVTNLHFNDGIIFFRKTMQAGYMIECLEEFGVYSKYINTIIDNLSEDEVYDVNILMKERNDISKTKFTIKK